MANKDELKGFIYVCGILGAMLHMASVIAFLMLLTYKAE